jgi:hypothetical protein
MACSCRLLQLIPIAIKGAFASPGARAAAPDHRAREAPGSPAVHREAGQASSPRRAHAERSYQLGWRRRRRSRPSAVGAADGADRVRLATDAVPARPYSATGERPHLRRRGRVWPSATAGFILLLTQLLAATSSAAATTTIVPYQATGYRYLEVPTGQEPSGWEGSSFDESSWGTGAAAFGSASGCPLQATVKTNWDVNTDMLLRKPITLPSGASGVTIHVTVDNDAKVYWNGTLVGSATHEGCPAYDDGVFSVPDNLLTSGTNVLAVQGSDRGAASFLDASVTGEPPPPNGAIQVAVDPVDPMNNHLNVPPQPAQSASVKLTGEITPGSTPVTAYHFVLTDSLTGQPHLTPSTPYVPGQQPSACVGQAAWCNQLGVLDPPIYLYRPWSYELVATDGSGDHPSSPGTFIPGGLQNPPNLDLTFGANGPGIYNINIDCSKAPCAALATESGTSRRSVKGGWQVPGRGGTTRCRSRPQGGPRCGPGGVLLIGAYDRESGRFAGQILMGGSVWNPGRASEQSGLVGYTGLYHIQGQVLLSTVRLEFTLVPDYPHTSVPAQFTLAGVVTDYGGQGASGAGYFPSGGGPVDPRGSSNAWSFCTDNPRACQPPADNTKQIAGNVGVVVGAMGLVTGPLQLPLGVFGTVMGLISADPPDQQYKQISRPAKVSKFTVAVSRGVNRRAASAASRVMTDLLRAAAVGQATLDGIQRYTGALLADNRKWVVRQARAAVKYGRQFAALCRRLATKLRASRRVLASSALGTRRVSARELRRLLRSARTHGLPAATAAELRRLGVSTASIRHARTLLPTKAGATSLLGPLLTPGFNDQLRETADMLDAYLAGLAQAARHP